MAVVVRIEAAVSPKKEAITNPINPKAVRPIHAPLLSRAPNDAFLS